MSATFRLAAKKKLSQNDMRKLMNEHKTKSQSTKVEKKIDSPLAKYNELGQLTCILCKSIVRSEDVWKVHINAKQHKENVTAAKELKERTQNFTSAIKRPPTPPRNDIPTKKIKGILKNSSSTVQQIVESQQELPADFFDNKAPVIFKKPIGKFQQQPTKETTIENSDELPEGFFDDPILDAKVRNLEYKDPLEEEWDKFQKQMREESTVSNAIIAEDQDEATADRQIDEIDEQMRNWSRVLDLEKRIQEVIVAEKIKSKKMEIGDDDDSNDENDDGGSDEEFDEFLDWRAKKLQR